MRKGFLIWDTPENAIYLVVITLLCVGGLNVFSASFVKTAAEYGDKYYYLMRYAFWAVIGLFLLILVSKCDYKKILNGSSLKLFTGFCFLLLLCVPFLGTVVNGARRWLSLGSISLQPSELIKVAEVMLAAGLLGKKMSKEREITAREIFAFDKNILCCMLYSLVAAVFILFQPDMGTAAIVLGVMVVMFILAGLSKKWIAVLGGLLILVVPVLVVKASYRMKRIKVWLDPWQDAGDTGYQMVQSRLAIGSGGWTGMHWGQGGSKFFYLPEAHTDFAFAVFSQEWGFIGCLFLIIAFIVLAWAFLYIACNTRDKQGFLLVSGVGFLIVGQAAANMAMVTGLLPVIGVPLLFISYGGTSMVMNMIAIGLVLSVCRKERWEREKEERRKNVRVVVSDGVVRKRRSVQRGGRR